MPALTVFTREEVVATKTERVLLSSSLSDQSN